jgi:hypothetical protein
MPSLDVSEEEKRRTVSVEAIPNLRGDVGEEKGLVHRLLGDLGVGDGYPAIVSCSQTVSS